LNLESKDYSSCNVIITDIEMYIGILNACKTFICLMSGGAVLSAALGRNAVVLDGKATLSNYKFSINEYIDISKL